MIVATPASTGLARGFARLCQCALTPVVHRRSIDPGEVESELRRFDDAVATVEAELERLREEVSQTIGEVEAGVFDVHVLMLRESKLRSAVHRLCRDAAMNVEAAVEEAIRELETPFLRMDDDYLRERAADLREVGRRLLNHLGDASSLSPPSTSDDEILVTTELLSSVVARLESGAVRGLIVERGGVTAHASILARARGIPMIVQAEHATREISDGDRLILDALGGRIFITPGIAVEQRYDRLAADLRNHQILLQDQLGQPPITLDGVGIQLAANIGQTADAVAAGRIKAAGAGLYRTEFVFMAENHLPSEAEQYHFYKSTAECLAPERTAIRLLDVGSDKPLPYFSPPREENPALGNRGVRLLLEHPEILRPQLRAILRLAATLPVSILVPMVGGMDDWRAIREAIDDCAADLSAEGEVHNSTVPVGVMIETPGAVLLAAELAAAADFVSVGTNDLVQYLLAADRGDSENSSAYDPLHPAVLRALDSVVSAVNAAGKPLSLCGEIAGDPSFTALLLGLGFRRLSVVPSQLLEIKHAIRSIHLDEAADLAASVLAMDSTAEIHAAIGFEWQRRRPVTPPELTSATAVEPTTRLGSTRRP